MRYHWDRNWINSRNIGRKQDEGNLQKLLQYPCPFCSVIDFILNSLTALFIFTQGQCDNHSLTAIKFYVLSLTLFMRDSPSPPIECMYDICAYPELQITRPRRKTPALPSFICHLELLHSTLYCQDIRWVTGILFFQCFFCFFYPSLKDFQVLGKGLIVQDSSLEYKRIHSLITSASQPPYWHYNLVYSHIDLQTVELARSNCNSCFVCGLWNSIFFFRLDKNFWS